MNFIICKTVILAALVITSVFGRHQHTHECSVPAIDKFHQIVPVIDLGLLKSEDEEIRKAEEDRLFDGMRYVGFFVLTNHTMNRTLMDQQWNISKEFFHSSHENKHSLPKHSETSLNGFSDEEVLGLSEHVYQDSNDTEDSTVATSVDSDGTQQESEEDEDVQFDHKETYQVCINDENTPVPWPQYPSNMEQIWTDYYYECESIMKQLFVSMANILNLSDPEFFHKKIENHVSILRANYYPSHFYDHTDEEDDGSDLMRCSEHSDWGILTLLRQDQTNGLQVKLNGTWYDVKSDFYDFVINIGDAMERWTNNKFISTKHRVVLRSDHSIDSCDTNNDGNVDHNDDSVSINFVKNVKHNDSHSHIHERYSMAYFQHLGLDEEIRTFDSCLDENGNTKYDPITFAQHHASKRERVYGNYEN